MLVRAIRCSIVSVALLAGVLVDRLGAWRIAPFVLIPMGLGSVALALFDAVWMIPVFFILFGMTNGMMSPIVGALWAEIYGTAHLGAIRALATAAFVLASAVGPGVAGVLVDAGVELDQQGLGYAAYCFVMVAVYVALMPRFAERAGAIHAERAALTPAQ